jgi:periplasmic divalent cation tolerance protein
MNQTGKYRLVLVTAPDLKTARKLAKTALKARLIACANLIPGLESHYRWAGKIEHATEVLLLFKTSAARIGKLQSHIIALHPYDTPEFLVVDLEGGYGKYLTWLAESVAR